LYWCREVSVEVKRKTWKRDVETMKRTIRLRRKVEQGVEEEKLVERKGQGLGTRKLTGIRTRTGTVTSKRTRTLT
jgi:hypothetical protein